MKEYYIDFESWHIMANSKQDAYNKALEQLKRENPNICNCDLNEV